MRLLHHRRAPRQKERSPVPLLPLHAQEQEAGLRRPRLHIRQEEFAQEVKRNTAIASIPEEWKERFLARIETWEAEEHQTSQAQVDRLKAEIDRVNNAFTEGAMELREFKEIKKPLIARKTELEQQAAVFTARRTNLRIPMNSDTHSGNNRTLIRDCRTVVGA
jgi:hypothetical protein